MDSRTLYLFEGARYTAQALMQCTVPYSQRSTVDHDRLSPVVGATIIRNVFAKQAKKSGRTTHVTRCCLTVVKVFGPLGS